MKWFKGMSKFRQAKQTTLKAVNPRYGTSVIPLNVGDEMIFFSYLQDKIHALYFDGPDEDLFGMIKVLEKDQGVVVHKMNVIEGREDRLMHLHLALPNTTEIRRVIRIPS